MAKSPNKGIYDYLKLLSEVSWSDNPDKFVEKLQRAYLLDGDSRKSAYSSIRKAIKLEFVQKEREKSVLHQG